MVYSFWEIFGIGADILGVVSFGISIPTLLAAHGAKKALVEYKNTKRYDAEIEDHICLLKSLRETISNGDAYGENVLIDLYRELDAILIHFAPVVKPFAKHINRLKSTVNKTFQELGRDPNYNKRNIVLELNSTIERLEKVKKENKS